MPAGVPSRVLEDLSQTLRPYQHQVFQDADQIFNAAKESVQVIKKQQPSDDVPGSYYCFGRIEDSIAEML